MLNQNGRASQLDQEISFEFYESAEADALVVRINEIGLK
jgi:hypothetical protein